MTKKLTDFQVLEVCDRYVKGESSEILGKHFGVSSVAIRGLLTRRGVARRDSSSCVRRYICDYQYFDTINTQEKAYWLGFLAADGAITGKNEVTVSLACVDREHLIEFKNALKSSHPVKNYFYENRHSFCRFSIKSDHMTQSLNRMGIVKRKSLIVRTPDIPKELLKGFYRGYFDGDGSLIIPARNGNITFAISSNLVFLKQYQDYLVQECNVNAIKIYSDTRSSQGYGDLKYCGKDQVKRILDHFYLDSTIHLKRKWELYKSLF